MKKIYLPIIALLVGFANACLAFQVHSLLFCLLPLLAFALGYFSSSWKMGLLSSFLLFIGYTTAIALIRIPTSCPDSAEYLHNFLFGGFILCIIGCGAPMIKRGIKHSASIAVLVILALLISWCGYQSFPRYSYSYCVVIESSEDLNDLEFYLPIVVIAQKPYIEVFNHPVQCLYQRSGSPIPTEVIKDYSLDVVDTEHGKMLKLKVNQIQETPRPEIAFHMSKNVPHERLQFMPKYNAKKVKVVHSERFMGPIRVKVNEVVEEFKVPLKVTSDKEAEVRIWLNHGWGRSMAINFYNYKSEGYSESIKFQAATGDEWILADGEVVRSIGVGGVE